MGTKIQIKDIQEAIAPDGWKLLSDNYVNLDAQLIFECSEGHRIYAPWRKIRAKRECPVCKNNIYFNQQDKIIPKKKNVTRTLALDQATRTSGYAIFDGRELIKYGKYSTTVETEEERIEYVRTWMLSMIANWQPDYVILEDIQLQEEDSPKKLMGVTVFKTLAHLQGVLINTLHQAGIPHSTVLSAKWRSQFNIKGRTRADKKKSAQLCVKNWYDVSVTNDEADAICIGRYRTITQKEIEMIDW